MLNGCSPSDNLYLRDKTKPIELSFKIIMQCLPSMTNSHIITINNNNSNNNKKGNIVVRATALVYNCQWNKEISNLLNEFNSYSLTASASHHKVTPVLLKILLPSFTLMCIYLDFPNPWAT